MFSGDTEVAPPPDLMLEVTYWTPLIVLVLLSLGLLALKRVSGLPQWLKRLATPPFYFVSMPIATVLIGVEILAWIIAIHYVAFKAGLLLILLAIPAALLWGDVEAYIGTLYFILFWAGVFVSGHALRRILWFGREWRSKSQQRVDALLLLLAFVWVFVGMRSFVLFFGSRSIAVVCATSCDVVFDPHRLLALLAERI
jgi:hypothetical protein